MSLMRSETRHVNDCEKEQCLALRCTMAYDVLLEFCFMSSPPGRQPTNSIQDIQGPTLEGFFSP